MRLHRFFTGNDFELTHKFWFHDERILYQWNKVLRYRVDDQVILFDGMREDRQYRFLQLDEKSAHLELVTELVRKVPKNEVYLFWSLLKKEKNDWVLQKCTELGVSHFVPLITDRTEKTGFDEDRANKIVIEATEQCGRSDIPRIVTPMKLDEALHKYAQHCRLYLAEQTDSITSLENSSEEAIGVLIGPEGGWSVAEKQLILGSGISALNLSDFTLRAETAALAAVAKVII